MNTSGFIRGMMSKNLNGEDFIKHVVSCVEQELQQWDADYEVLLLKITDYTIIVKNGKQSYWAEISESKLNELQKRSPYALDHEVWTKFQTDGIEIGEMTGNYLKYVLM